MISRFARTITLFAVVAAILAPAAFAQDSSVSGYGGKGGEVVGATSNNDPNTASQDTTSGGDSGVLPFTGLDVGFLIGGGVLLLAAGAALARFRPHGETS